VQHELGVGDGEFPGVENGLNWFLHQLVDVVRGERYEQDGVMGAIVIILAPVQKSLHQL